MKEAKRRKLKKAGWKVGTVRQFLADIPQPKTRSLLNRLVKTHLEYVNIMFLLQHDPVAKGYRVWLSTIKNSLPKNKLVLNFVNQVEKDLKSKNSTRSDKGVKKKPVRRKRKPKLEDYTVSFAPPGNAGGYAFGGPVI